MSDIMAASTTGGLESVDTFCYMGDMLSAGGGVEEAVRCLVRCALGQVEWAYADLNNERDSSLKVRGKIYKVCVQQWWWYMAVKPRQWRLTRWGHAEVERENRGEYVTADVWRLSKETSVTWSSEEKTGYWLYIGPCET